MSVIVNGKKSDGLIFESGSKAFLIESVEGGEKLDVRMLYHKDGQINRTPKGIRLLMEDVVELISDIIQVADIPFEIVTMIEPSKITTPEEMGA